MNARTDLALQVRAILEAQGFRIIKFYSHIFSSKLDVYATDTKGRKLEYKCYFEGEHPKKKVVFEEVGQSDWIENLELLDAALDD